MNRKVNFNFAEGKAISQKHLYSEVRYKKLFAVYTFWTAVLLALSLPWLWDLKTVYGQKVADNNIKSYQEIYAVLQKRENLNDRIDQSQQFLNFIEEKSKQPRGTLNTLQKSLPSDVVLKSLSQMEDGSVQLTVGVSGPENMAKVWTAVAKTGVFQEIDLNTVAVTGTTEKKDLIFSLKLK
ncbi:Fimbrial assembly family protein [Syntrophobotulus glycolicus DSM 8271]|uniref:Fimbrial assembly family protein n=1 Tax=Syntrophobotulus glycolicus (strain DSM 8271 / FlGlyR) TaxID=645991 RepID=F0T0U5_SYNGF|nr:hypothetical protein [Syntrophobotulus glycolicus]ADY56234.1 Fimbrial assembly family protein [Syntrophobotulus glycolicus DSM 8271]